MEKETSSRNDLMLNIVENNRQPRVMELFKLHTDGDISIKSLSKKQKERLRNLLTEDVKERLPLPGEEGYEEQFRDESMLELDYEQQLMIQEYFLLGAKIDKGEAEEDEFGRWIELSNHPNSGEWLPSMLGTDCPF